MPSVSQITDFNFRSKSRALRSKKNCANTKRSESKAFIDDNLPKSIFVPSGRLRHPCQTPNLPRWCDAWRWNWMKRGRETERARRKQTKKWLSVVWHMQIAVVSRTFYQSNGNKWHEITYDYLLSSKHITKFKFMYARVSIPHSRFSFILFYSTVPSRSTSVHTATEHWFLAESEQNDSQSSHPERAHESTKKKREYGTRNLFIFSSELLLLTLQHPI